MTAPAPFPHPEELGRYDRLVATQPGVERKGATLPYTSVNGHMFSYMDAAGTLALRLGGTERQAFLERYDARPMVAHGIEQKDYVAVPPDLLDRTAELEPWFAASLARASSRKPKPAKR